MQEAAQSLGILLVGPSLEGTLQESEYRRVFEAMAQEHPDALYVSSDPENFATGFDKLTDGVNRRQHGLHSRLCRSIHSAGGIHRSDPQRRTA